MSEPHQLKQRERGGSAETAWIRPVCSCGWQGDKFYAWQDYQHTLAKDQESAHLRAAREQNQLAASPTP